VAKSCGADAQIQLATGSLDTSAGATNQVSIIGNIPSAAVDVTVDTALAGFWLAPSDLTTLFFETSFTNTPGEIAHIGNKFVVGGCARQACPGGGTFDLMQEVPEPVTVSLFGAGLAGAAALRRRKSKKA
jgi:hypothetical protein